MKYFLICLFFISSTSYAIVHNEDTFKCGKVVKFTSVSTDTKYKVSMKTIEDESIELWLKKDNSDALAQMILTAFTTRAMLCVETLDSSIVSADITADNE